jgi:hypothetical protein
MVQGYHYGAIGYVFLALKRKILQRKILKGGFQRVVLELLLLFYLL